MSFLVRAALVIGILSWLALQRQGAALPDPTAAAKGALAGWDALPASVRAEALREGGARIARRAAGNPVSGDTLADTDRTPAWRGAEAQPRF